MYEEEIPTKVIIGSMQMTILVYGNGTYQIIKWPINIMKTFLEIILEIQAVCNLRREAEKCLPLKSVYLKNLVYELDGYQMELEHELQALLGIEIGDWETLYTYIKLWNELAKK